MTHASINLFDAFSRKAPNKVFFSIVLGALAGIAYSFLIPIVLASIAPDGGHLSGVESEIDTFLTFEVAHYRFGSLFIFTCLFILFARTCSQVMLLRISMDVATDLRVRIYHRISAAPINYLERMGASKLTILLTSDINRIVMGARLLPDLLISIVTLVGLLGFLLYMNTPVFWFVMGSIFFGALSYQIPMYWGNRSFLQARAVADCLQESIHGLIHGAKELKLNQTKRSKFFTEMLLANEEATLKLEKRGATVVRAAMSYGDLISFFVIGAVTFIFVNYHTLSKAELVGVVMALLYLTGPVASILNFIPQILLARISLRQVEYMLAELPEEDCTSGPTTELSWQTVRFQDVYYRHSNNDASAGFEIGPINLTLARGQITFIVGGNGSGKSTLSKLLTLHYVPSGGQIVFGDTAVHAQTLTQCRDQVCAIFSDYYLFDRLFDAADAQLQSRVNDYLVAFQLDHKVSVENGRFSTLALSAGQRRRLALLVAFLEDKNLYLFDEWAADQDSMFKQVFYEKLLPDLKARNKAVVVISHDDRYFHVADKIVVMEEGRLQPDSPQLLHLASAPVS